jgi:predicted ATPase/DNA-binding winged helix-turn-helix (wHTH) protein
MAEGQPMSLGARAFDVLQALIERRERLVTKNELLDLVWPGVVVEENNLQVQISTLRKLLGPLAIATIPGRGYRFTIDLDGSSPTGQADVLALARPAQSEETANGNLPADLPPLIGRDDAVRELSNLVEMHRIVTITGAGGMGKTTLALAVARQLKARFRDGAWLVELASVSDPALVAQTVAQTLRIAVTESGVAQQRLIDVLASQHILLVLDNSEHVADAIGRLALALTTHAPELHVLTTSQKLLNVPGETVFKLGPLSTPADDDVEELERSGAVRLFVERARAVQQNFALSPVNAESVAEICRRLDGMPLAIELAAARVRLFGVSGLRERLDQRFKLLTGGSRAAAPRHQALLATIDWSQTLLSEHERAVLRRLSVCVGGFGLEIAQRVGVGQSEDAWTVIDALSALVDGSLVQVDASDVPRYRLLESTRAYALEQLTQAGEMDATLRRHAGAVRDLFVDTEEQRFGERGSLTMAGYMQTLSPELDNLRVAFDWSVGQGNDIETAIALVGASSMLFRWLGLSQEGLDRLLALRSQAENIADRHRQAMFWSSVQDLGDVGRLPTPELLEAQRRATAAYRASGERRRLVRSLYGFGWVLAILDRHEEAMHVLEEMKQLERATDPPWLRALRLNLAGVGFLVAGEFEAAVAVHQEQRRLLMHAAGEEISLIICQNNLCAALNCLGRFEEVIAIAESSVQCASGHSLGTLVYMMFQLLHAHLSLGRLDDAELTMRRAMPAWRRDAMVFFGANHLVMLLAEQGRLADAARIDGASTAHVQRTGSRPSPVRTLARRRTLELFEAARLDPADLARWRREGETLDESGIAALCVQK